MKKAIAIALSLCLLMCGCSGNGIRREQDVPKPSVGGRFLCDAGNYGFETVVDSQTGVTYLIWKEPEAKSTTGGITVLLDRDGKPIISEEVAE